VWLVNLGDGSSTHEIAIAIFAIAGGIFAASFSESWLGKRGLNDGNE
jgi:hypothetical protein